MCNSDKAIVVILVGLAFILGLGVGGFIGAHKELSHVVKHGQFELDGNVYRVTSPEGK